MTLQNWDKYDQEAYELYEMEEYLRREGLLTKHDSKYAPKCYICKGTGQKFDRFTYKPSGPCPACGGKGFKVAKPIFTNREAKDIVAQLSPGTIQRLIREYGEKRNKG